MYVGGVESGVCGFYTTLHTKYVTHVGGVEGELYSVYSGLSPLQGGKAIYYSTVFEKPSILGFSSLPPVSLRSQLC